MSHSLYTAVLAFWLVAGFQPTPASVVLHELRLTVVDVSGGVIVGATVTMDGADKDHRTGVTDARGQFAVGALGPGKYRVQVAAPGFAVFSTTVDVRQPVTTLDVTLQVAIAESVEVAMVSARLEAGTGLASTTLSGLALEALPEDPNTLLRHLNELAGTTGQPGELVISVDGFPQAVRLPPKQAIQLIRISSNPFAAEFADLGRARVDVVTKPGSSQVHADLRGSLNSAAMNARNRFATDRPDEKTQNVSGYVSGPIVPNRWSFVGYGGHWRSDDTQVVSATVLDPVDLEAAPLSLNVPSSSRVFNVWLGTDARIGTTNTLAMSGSTIDERADNQGLESGLDLPERAYRHRSNSRDLRLTLTSLGGPRVFNEVRIQATSGRTRSQAIDERPAIVVFDAFNGGGQQTALFAERQQSRLHLAERLTMSAARHTLKFGFDVERLSYLERDRSNFGGTFVFGADMERDAAGAPVLGDGDVPIAIAPLENYRRTLLGLPGYGPSQFSIAQGSEAVSAWQWQYGAFAQDDWAVHPRFTLSYGVRHEWETDVPASHGPRTRRGATPFASAPAYSFKASRLT
jgi:hypothetical protein